MGIAWQLSGQAFFVTVYNDKKSFLYSRLSKRMDSNSLSVDNTCHIKQHRSGTMSDHNFSLLSECRNNSHQILIIRFVSMLGKLWYGISAWEYHRIKFIFMSFQICNNIICSPSWISDISQRMLTVTLRTLEADGLVSRTVYAEVPPRVEYQLTETGKTLIPHIESLVDWALEHMTGIFDSREKAGQPCG